MRIQATPSTATPRAHTQPQTALDLEEASRGCGWFDSSYELSQGLVVTEDTYDSHHCLAAWPELTRIILGQSMLDSLNPARFS